MNRKKQFITGMLLLVLLQFADLFTTWLGTPDLSEEANAFVRWFGFGWLELILVSLAMILFVAIPFYFHILLFNYPLDKEQTSWLSVFNHYFFKNHPNKGLAVLRALFDILGYFLFWWLALSKLTAILHNSFQLADASFWKISFEKQMFIMDGFERIALIGIMILFFIILLYNAKAKPVRLLSLKKMPPVLIIIFSGLFISFQLFKVFAKRIHSVDLVNTMDPDIILVNLGTLNRADIAGLLFSIDSCKPAAIGIDVLFTQERNGLEDSMLMNALKGTKHEIICYRLDEKGNPNDIQPKFSQFASDSGFVSFGFINGLVTKITPVRKINGIIYEGFPLQVIKQWKPSFRHKLTPNQTISINYSRTVNKYIQVEAGQIGDLEPGLLQNKIILIGYTGPGDEDMYYTPVQLVRPIAEAGPDMYGLVIYANAIRTILEYEVHD